jgi:hypothetical protein
MVAASTSRAFISHLDSLSQIQYDGPDIKMALDSQADYQDVTIRAKEVKAAALSILSQCHGVGDARQGLERRAAPLAALFATSWSQVAFIGIAYVQAPTFHSPFGGEAGINCYFVHQNDYPAFDCQSPGHNYKGVGNRR